VNVHRFAVEVGRAGALRLLIHQPQTAVPPSTFLSSSEVLA
jgi:hypothetical protein